jgi:hypothetical protein
MSTQDDLGPREKHLGLDEPMQEPEPVDLEALQPEQPAEAEPEKPEWLDPRFNTVEAQAQAYSAAERQMHAVNQEKADMEKRLAALEERYDPNNYQQPYDPGYDQNYYDPVTQASYEEQLRQLAETDPLAAMRAIAAEQAQALQAQQMQAAQLQQMSQAQQQPLVQQQQETQAALVANEAKRNVTARHEDFRNYEDQIAQVLTDDPEFISGQHAWDLQKLERGLERAYKIVKAEEWAGHEQELRDQGVAPEDLERHRKMAAQTMQGVSARPDEPTQEEKQLADMVNTGMQSYGAARKHLWGDMRAPTT